MIRYLVFQFSIYSTRIFSRGSGISISVFRSGTKSSLHTLLGSILYDKPSQPKMSKMSNYQKICAPIYLTTLPQCTNIQVLLGFVHVWVPTVYTSPVGPSTNSDAPKCFCQLHLYSTFLMLLNPSADRNTSHHNIQIDALVFFDNM